jgi:hypothetical protein
MEIWLLFVIIFFCAIGMAVTAGLKAACMEAERLGAQLMRESQEVQELFDKAIRELLQAQEPQNAAPVEGMVFRMDLKRK